MKMSAPILLISFTLAMVAASCTPTEVSDRSDADLVLSNINIIDVVSGAVIAGQDVFIDGARITEITPHGRSTTNAKSTHDGAGQYLSPGLWDMHTHIRANAHEDHMPMFIAHGVTGLRDLGLTHRGLIKQWRAAISAGEIVGPRIISSGVIIEGPEPRFPSSLSVSSVEDVKPVVDGLIGEGFEVIKIFQSVPADAFDALVAYAHENNLPTSGHVPPEWTHVRAAQSNLDSIEHLYGIGNSFSEYDNGNISLEELDSLATALIEHGVFQCPTLVNSEYFVKLAQSLNDPAREAGFFKDDPRLAYVPAYFKAWWAGINAANREAFTTDDYAGFAGQLELKARIVAELSARGVKILAGTDASNPYIVAGISLHDELGLFVDAGMSEAEALRTATLYPAQYFSKEGEFGTVVTGALADLVILEGNPLEGIAQVRAVAGVIANGHFFDKTALETLRSEQRVRLAEADPSGFDQVIYMDVRRNGVTAVREKYPAPLRDDAPYTVEPDHLRRLSTAMVVGFEPDEARLALEWNIELFPEDTASRAALAELSAHTDE